MGRSQKEDWVSLGCLWQSRGFMNMPVSVMYALLGGLNTPPESAPATVTSADVVADLLARCRRYVESADLNVSLVPPERGVRKSLIGVLPVFQHITIGDIEVDLSKQRVNRFYDVRLSPGDRDVVPRWEWWPFCFGVVWALLFHVENEYLRRPHILWHKMYQLAAIQRGLRLGVAMGRSNYSGPPLYLALLERLLGIRHDIATNAPHYLANVASRPGLSESELEERPILFRAAVDDLLKRTAGQLGLTV